MTSCHFASQSSSWVILLIHHQNTTPGLTWHDVLYLLLHSSFLYHSLILFLSATTLAAPLGPEEVVAELPDSIQNTFQRHKLKISSGPNGSYFPSLHSSNTEPLSSARTVCHCPAGTFTRKLGPPGVNSILSVQIRSNSS
jgi:hypothetical protein